MQKRLLAIIQSKTFKKITVVLGIAFLVLTFFISFKPEPFLKFSYLGVFVFNLFGPGTLLIPSLSRHMNIFLLAFFTALGMSFNDSVSWVIGRNGDVIIPRSKKVLKIESGLHKFGPYALFVWSLIPFPYDLIGLIAGYLEFPYKTFILPTFLGRFLRLALIGFGVVAIWGKI
jgi:membrane protein YqaA with SNARE-associated domain